MQCVIWKEIWKNRQQTNGKPKEMLAIKNKLQHPFPPSPKMNSVSLKHKAQPGSVAPCPFHASFIGHFTAIFYAHEK